MVNKKNKASGICWNKKRPFEKPLKSRVQLLEVKKKFPNQPNVCTVYTLKKVSNFVPLPYEHLIRQDPHRRPATQTCLPPEIAQGQNLNMRVFISYSLLIMKIHQSFLRTHQNSFQHIFHRSSTTKACFTIPKIPWPI